MKSIFANELLELWQLLGEYGAIKRQTLLPNGSAEYDSHHAFTLALMGYELAAKYAPELDQEKILLYGLVHDLPEIITGDINTVRYTSEEFSDKETQDRIALQQISERLQKFPSIRAALQSYEAKEDDESLYIYWIDKVMPGLSHFSDHGTRLRELGVQTPDDIDIWYGHVQRKLYRFGEPHPVAKRVLKEAYLHMRNDILAQTIAAADKTS